VLTSAWRKSSRSDNNGDCVAASRHAATVEMRDSKDHSGPVLGFHQDRWHDSLKGIVPCTGDDRSALCPSFFT
jgi:hypothetical protein